MNARGNANYKENLKNGNNGLYGWQVKKTTATGDTSNLRGYTVGSRAPPMAVSSGTTIAQDGGRYKGVARQSGTKYSVPSIFGDASDLDLRTLSSKSDLFTHNTNMLSSDGPKDCFYTRGKTGPLAATNEIFIHESYMIAVDGKKDTFLNRGLKGTFAFLN